MKTIAIFGAGPALGLSLAKRFGAEGYRVALVARRQESLDAIVAELSGVETATFLADVADRGQLDAAVTAIEARFGHVDVAVYSPGGLDRRPVGVLAVDPDELYFDLWLRSPIALANRLVPGMRERGDGVLLFASGTSAVTPEPALASASLVLAGTRNYVHNLNAALASEGVYAGVVPIGGLIRRSAPERLIASGDHGFDGFDVDSLRLIDPDDVAETFWDLAVKRDRAEEIVGVG
jgi:short-subunit dehydrogenase